MAEKNLEQMKEAVAEIREKMAAAAREAGRDPAAVQLCAACKTRTAQTVAASAALPIDVFGENHVQELCANFDAGAYCGKPSHFIGHLQTNKIKKVLGRASLIQSVDSEHLNRAIIIEREAAEKYGWEEVCVVPRPHAGGSWATTCWKKFREPVAVEEIRAHAGIDIGGTLIGMHLRRVAVPVRLSLSKIGEANILCARTRPKLIGGERAKYTEED